VYGAGIFRFPKIKLHTTTPAPDISQPRLPGASATDDIYPGCDCAGRCRGVLEGCACRIRASQAGAYVFPHFECHPKCRCRQTMCANRASQTNLSDSRLEVHWLADKGFGVKARQPIKQRTPLCIYAGDVLKQQSAAAPAKPGASPAPIYRLTVRENLKDKTLVTTIDATAAGNVARFFNHSCKPNVELHVVRMGFVPRVLLVTRRDVGAGEELCFDYAAGAKPEDIKLSATRCLCLGKNCRAFLPAVG
jgi:hypothetical protein